MKAKKRTVPQISKRKGMTIEEYISKKMKLMTFSKGVKK